MTQQKTSRTDASRLDQVVATARRLRDDRERDYREQALKLYPWICGRCQREFTRENVHELTVHHRDHNHDFNPVDGSNWELLCLYCHDNEHMRHFEELKHSERVFAKKVVYSSWSAKITNRLGSGVKMKSSQSLKAASRSDTTSS